MPAFLTPLALLYDVHEGRQRSHLAERYFPLCVCIAADAMPFVMPFALVLLQAIMNILLNVPDVDIGEDLKEFKLMTSQFTAEDRGLARKKAVQSSVCG